MNNNSQEWSIIILDLVDWLTYTTWLFCVGGSPGAPDGPYAWGYCFVRQKDKNLICEPQKGPCPPGKVYYGRGPIQLTQ